MTSTGLLDHLFILFLNAIRNAVFSYPNETKSRVYNVYFSWLCTNCSRFSTYKFNLNICNSFSSNNSSTTSTLQTLLRVSISTKDFNTTPLMQKKADSLRFLKDCVTTEWLKWKLHSAVIKTTLNHKHDWYF